MASSNRAQQTRVPRGGGGRRTNVSSQHHDSSVSYPADGIDTRKIVLKQLEELFSGVFERPVIENVAEICHWDLNKSIDMLFVISPEDEVGKECKILPKSKLHAGSTFQQDEKLLVKNQHITEPQKRKNRRCKEKGLKSPNNANSVTKIADSYGAFGLQQSQNTTMMMNAVQGASIKVAYRRASLMKTEEEEYDEDDDDDADVVIEEENEVEIIGNNSPTGTFSFTDNTSSFYQLVPSTVSQVPPVSKGSRSTEDLLTSRMKDVSEFNKFDDKTAQNLDKKNFALHTAIKSQPKVKLLSGVGRVRKLIMKGYKVMVLMRGCPGSGKSYLAKQIIEKTVRGDPRNYVLSIDDYFIQIGGGQYVFLPERLPEAHYWNQCCALNEARSGTNPIIIDNCNLEIWEMKEYAEIAVKFGYSLELLEPNTPWRYNAAELTRKNIHNIPRKRIEDMLARFEPDLNGGKLLALLNLKYSPPVKPPQLAANPILQKKVIDSAAAKKVYKRTRTRRQKATKVRNVSKCTANVAGAVIRSSQINSFQASEEKSSLHEEGKHVPGTRKLGITPFAVEVIENSKFLKGDLEEEINEIEYNRKHPSLLQLSDRSMGVDSADNDSADGASSYCSDDILIMQQNVITSEEEEDSQHQSDQGNETVDFMQSCKAEGSPYLENLGATASIVQEEHDFTQSSIFHTNIENNCWEYLLVLDDGYLLPQKSHFTENGEGKKSPGTPNRNWEHVIIDAHEFRQTSETNENKVDLNSERMANDSVYEKNDQKCGDDEIDCQNIKGNNNPLTLEFNDTQLLPDIKECQVANNLFGIFSNDVKSSRNGKRGTETKDTYQPLGAYTPKHTISVEEMDQWLNSFGPNGEKSDIQNRNILDTSLLVSSERSNNKMTREHDISKGKKIQDLKLVNTRDMFDSVVTQSSVTKRSVQNKKCEVAEKVACISGTQVSTMSPLTSSMLEQKVKPMSVTERVKHSILVGHKVMVLMRGCPGSGKSYLAKNIIKSTLGGNFSKYIFSTDNFFINLGQGKYIFRPEKLQEGHYWNQCKVQTAARNGINPIIVDNTNLELWEIKPYAEIAVKYGYKLELLQPNTSWRYNASELARKNIHDVPHRKIQDMLDRFERNLTGEKVLSLLKLKYSSSVRPPQAAAEAPPILKTDSSATGKNKRVRKKKKKSSPVNEINSNKSSHIPRQGFEEFMSQILMHGFNSQNLLAGAPSYLGKFHEEAQKSGAVALPLEVIENNQILNEFRNNVAPRMLQLNHEHSSIPAHDFGSSENMDEEDSDDNIYSSEKSSGLISSERMAERTNEDDVGKNDCISMLKKEIIDKHTLNVCNSTCEDVLELQCGKSYKQINIDHHLEQGIVDQKLDMDTQPNENKANRKLSGEIAENINDEAEKCKHLVDDCHVSNNEKLIPDVNFQSVMKDFDGENEVASLISEKSEAQNSFAGCSVTVLCSDADMSEANEKSVQKPQEYSTQNKDGEAKSILHLPYSADSMRKHVISEEQINQWLNAVDPCYETLCFSEQKESSPKSGSPNLETVKDEVSATITEISEGDYSHSERHDRDDSNECRQTSESKFDNNSFQLPDFEQMQWMSTFENIRKLIYDNSKVMVLLRGCPGSGKTYLATSIIKAALCGDLNDFVFSTDDYFVQLGNGQYTFIPEKLQEAHYWNQCRVLSAAINDTNPIIVDNMNLELLEMKPYAEIAVKYGYAIEILEPNTPWKYNASVLANKNVHRVPRQKIEDMLNCFDQTLNGDQLLNLLQLKSCHTSPPQQNSVTYSQTGKLWKSSATRNVTKRNTKRSRRKSNKDRNKANKKFAKRLGVSNFVSFFKGYDIPKGTVPSTHEEGKSNPKLLQGLKNVPLMNDSLSDYSLQSGVSCSAFELPGVTTGNLCDLSVHHHDDGSCSVIYYSDSSVLESDVDEKSNEGDVKFLRLSKEGKTNAVNDSSKLVDESATSQKIHDEQFNDTSNCNEVILQGGTTVLCKILSREELLKTKQTEAAIRDGHIFDSDGLNLRETNNMALSCSGEALKYSNSKQVFNTSQNIDAVHDSSMSHSDRFIKQESLPVCSSTEVNFQVGSGNNSVGMDSCDEMELASLIGSERNETCSVIAKPCIAMISSKIEAFEDVNEFLHARVENKPEVGVLDSEHCNQPSSIIGITLEGLNQSDKVGNKSENVYKDLMVCGKNSVSVKETNVNELVNKTTTENLFKDDSLAPAYVENDISRDKEGIANNSASSGQGLEIGDDVNLIENRNILDGVDNEITSLQEDTIENSEVGTKTYECSSRNVIPSTHDFTGHENCAESAEVEKSKEGFIQNSDVPIHASNFPGIIEVNLNDNFESKINSLNRNVSSTDLKITPAPELALQESRVETNNRKNDSEGIVPKSDLQKGNLNVPVNASYCLKVTDCNSLEEDFENASENSLLTSTVEKSDIDSFQEASFRTTNILNDGNLSILESKMHDTTSAEEDYESAVSSELSDDDGIGGRNKTTTTTNIGDFLKEEKKLDQCVENKIIHQCSKTEHTNLLGETIISEDQKVTLELFKSDDDSKTAHTYSLSANSGSMPSVCLSSEIQHTWDEGNVWNDCESQEYVVKSCKERADGPPTPKPARQHRNKTESRSYGEKVIFPFGDGVENANGESIPLEVQKWSAVSEPIASWEEKNEDDTKDQVVNKPPDFPQPQRSLFAGKTSKLDVDTLGCQLSDLSIASGTLVTESFSTQEGFESRALSSFEGQVIQNSQQDIASCFDLEGEGLPGRVSSSTNTHHSDFLVLQNVNKGCNVDSKSDVTIRDTHCRNIAEFIRSSPPKIPQLLMLDKSSMTSHYDHISTSHPKDAERHYEQLAHMFPHISNDELRGLYESCQRDVNWTVDLLLESEREKIKLSSGNISTSWEKGNVTDLLQSSEMSNASNEKMFGDFATSYNSDNSVGHTIQMNASVSSLPSPSSQLEAVPDVKLSGGIYSKAPLPRRSNRRDRNASVSELSMQIKKQWEESIVINDEHYSEHILRLRKLRHGELTNVWEMNDTSTSFDDQGNGVNRSSGFDISSDIGQFNSSICPDMSFANSSDAAAASVNNVSQAGNFQEEEGDLNESTKDEDDTTMQFVLDGTFINQLQKLFGPSGLPCFQDVTPAVTLPVSLARQIFYYVMESQQSMYETMMQEDQDLARSLQEQEMASSSQSPEVPPLQEIMDMEMALRLYKADEGQWRTETKDDLATKLSKQLLSETFPHLEHDVLMNVFQAHNNSFEQTFEVLMASTGQNDHEEVLTVMTPEARAAHEKALLDKAVEESLKNLEQVQLHVPRKQEALTQDEAYADADFYRCEANHHYQLRKDCLQKAQNSYRRGLPAVATYYSQMAALHKKRVEDSNAHAASSLLLAHSVGELTTTLDLHFLYVVEAVQVLNVFLDHHVSRLEEIGWRKQVVYIITGRGLRSSGGYSRIRPAVEEQLKVRGLKYKALNPGFLEVVVTRNSALSTNISL